MQIKNNLWAFRFNKKEKNRALNDSEWSAQTCFPRDVKNFWRFIKRIWKVLCVCMWLGVIFSRDSKATASKVQIVVASSEPVIFCFLAINFYLRYRITLPLFHHPTVRRGNPSLITTVTEKLVFLLATTCANRFAMLLGLWKCVSINASLCANACRWKK